MRNRSRLLFPMDVLVLVGTLSLFLACGGASAPAGLATSTNAPATTLSYTAPATVGSAYRLVRSATSTGTHLVLDLVGPAGTQIKGVVLTLSADTAKATWNNPGGTTDPYIKEGQLLALGAGTKLIKSQLSGSGLQVALFQKGTAAAATLDYQPILSVALDLKAGTTPGPVSLSSATAQILDANGTTQAITVAMGTLTAQ